MATSKPRHSITFEPADYDVLRRMAALEGSSVSKIVSELVGAVTPALSRAVDVMEAAARAHEDVHESLRRSAEEAEGPLLDVMQTSLDEFEAVMAQMQSVAEGNPRPVITGVRSGNTHDPAPLESSSDQEVSR